MRVGQSWKLPPSSANLAALQWGPRKRPKARHKTVTETNGSMGSGAGLLRSKRQAVSVDGLRTSSAGKKIYPQFEGRWWPDTFEKLGRCLLSYRSRTRLGSSCNLFAKYSTSSRSLGLLRSSLDRIRS